MARQAPAHDRIVADVQGRIDRGELRAGLIETIPAKGRYVRDPSHEAGPASPRGHARHLAAELRAEILDGRIAPGSPFHSESAIRERFGVSRYVARVALGDLEAAGLITSVHGRGRFVSDSSGAIG